MNEMYQCGNVYRKKTKNTSKHKKAIKLNAII